MEGSDWISDCRSLSCSGILKFQRFWKNYTIIAKLHELDYHEIKFEILSCYQGEGIVSVPFTSVSKETLTNLLDKFNDPSGPYHSDGRMAETKLL